MFGKLLFAFFLGFANWEMAATQGAQRAKWKFVVQPFDSTYVCNIQSAIYETLNNCSDRCLGGIA